MAYPYFTPSLSRETIRATLDQLNASLEELETKLSIRATLENRPYLHKNSSNNLCPYSSFTSNPVNGNPHHINGHFPPNLATSMYPTGGMNSIHNNYNSNPMHFQADDGFFSNRTQVNQTQNLYAPNQFTSTTPRFQSTYYYDQSPMSTLSRVDATYSTRSVHTQTEIQDVRFALRLFDFRSAPSTPANSSHLPSRQIFNLASKICKNKDRPTKSRPLKKQCDRLTTSFQQIFSPTKQKKLTKYADNEQEMYRTRFLYCFESTCEQTFINQLELKLHMRLKHDIHFYPCPLILECERSFKNIEQLDLHLEEVHAKVPSWECYSCLRLFNKYPQFEHHLYLEHCQGHFECSFDGCTFTNLTRTKVILHYVQVHNGDLFFIDK